MSESNTTSNPPPDLIARMRREHGLGWHPRGGWCRKFPGDRNRTYFGKVPEGEAVRRANREADRRAGLLRAEADAEVMMSRMVAKEAANLFLSHTDAEHAAGKISAAQRASYGQEVDFFLTAKDDEGRAIVGLRRPMSDFCKMTAPDVLFRPLRVAAMSRGVFAAEKCITQIRTFLDWCSTIRRFMPAPFYADAFSPPAEKEKLASRKAQRRAKGVAFWEPADVRRIVEAAKATDVHRYAWVLLTLNGGMGATDLSNLEDGDIDWKRRCIDTERSKTIVPRVVPLWDETIAAMKASRAKRAEPADPACADRYFLTPKGRPLVTVRLSPTDKRKVERTDAVRNWFFRLVNPPKEEAGKRRRKRGPELGSLKRYRGGYYTLRSVTATLALGHGSDRNLDAVLLGHAFDRAILANYVRGDLVEKLRKITDHVHAQIWPEN